MTHPLRGAAAAIGVGQAGIPEATGRSHLELIGEAAHAALAEAGLTTRDVDGLFTANFVNLFAPLTVAEYLGIRPSWADGTQIGGSSLVHYVISAAMALKMGLCNVALITYGANPRSGRTTPMTRVEQYVYERPYRPRQPINAYALAAARHMYEYGTSRAQLAAVAVATRQWAMLNPEATMREPITIDDVLAARMIVDPFSLFDCCLVTDGAGAIVMVRAERAADHPQKPVYFLGGGSAITHDRIQAKPDITVTAAVESGARAFAMAGLTPADVDVVELYDAFTINPILFLEDLGFCAKGEGGGFVADGAIAPGGRLPVNTNGGGLSCVHPGMYGIFLTIEAIRQLRGDTGARQVADAEIALCNGNGGLLSSQVTVLWGTPATV